MPHLTTGTATPSVRGDRALAAVLSAAVDPADRERLLDAMSGAVDVTGVVHLLPRPRTPQEPPPAA